MYQKQQQQQTTVYYVGQQQSKSTIIQQPINNQMNYVNFNQQQQQPFYYKFNEPKGLDILSSLNEILIQQKIEILEVITGYETNNKYVVRCKQGNKLFYAIEENDFCTRNCFGSLRPFTIKILDKQNNHLMEIYRPYRCTSCCCPCFLQEMEITADGKYLGSIEQEWSLFYPKFLVKNSTNTTIYRIEGPVLTFSCFGNDVEFQILSIDDDETIVGKISKKWSGLVQEMFTDADLFGIKFPNNIDVSTKALLMAATFLIN